MLTLTPAEIAAFRATYMHSLAMALIERNTPHWYSATNAERLEVRASLMNEIAVPDEKELAVVHQERRSAEIKELERARKMALPKTAPKTAGEAIKPSA